MSKGVWFWVIWVLAVLAYFGVFAFGWGGPIYGPVGQGVILFVLVGLVGWQVFGPPIQ
jgi:hypothetical protein